MATKTVVIPYCPRDAFVPFHERAERWAVIVAHRRAGKTVATVNDLIRRAIQDGKTNGRYAYVAPLYGQAKAVAWDYLRRFSQPLLANANETELRVDLVNGARIRLYGADNPDTLRGIALDGVVLDEVADMKPRVWSEVIRPALSDRQGWAVFIGTPKGHNSFYDIWTRAQDDPAWFTLRLKASDTHLIADDELASAKAQMSDDQYAQEWETSFEAAIQGAYYGKETAGGRAAGPHQQRAGGQGLARPHRVGLGHRRQHRHLVRAAGGQGSPGHRLLRSSLVWGSTTMPRSYRARITFGAITSSRTTRRSGNWAAAGRALRRWLAWALRHASRPGLEWTTVSTQPDSYSLAAGSTKAAPLTEWSC